MNIFSKTVQPGTEARISYGDGEFQVIAPGDFVRCAITSEPIALEELKYWSVGRQEAYASAAISFERLRESRENPD